nr:hypothetical protein [Tanacetum cinerariifolium]
MFSALSDFQQQFLSFRNCYMQQRKKLHADGRHQFPPNKRNIPLTPDMIQHLSGRVNVSFTGDTVDAPSPMEPSALTFIAKKRLPNSEQQTKSANTTHTQEADPTLGVRRCSTSQLEPIELQLMNGQPITTSNNKNSSYFFLSKISQKHHTTLIPFTYHPTTMVPLEYAHLGKYTCVCRHCGAMFWECEKNARSSYAHELGYIKCCYGGRIVLCAPPEYPEYIKQLYRDPHFMDNTMAYNQMFSMTSLGANVDSSINNGTRQYKLPTAKTIGAIVFGGSSVMESEFDLIVEEHSRKWPEIQEFMESFPELTTSDRVGVVDRVFKKEFRDYIKFVHSSRPFGDITTEKPSESEGFEEIIDFLNAKPIRYTLTVNPTLYALCVKQFWTTAKVKKRKQRHAAEVHSPSSKIPVKKSIPTPSNDPLPSGKDSIQLNELMIFCTSLQQQVLDLEEAKIAQAKEITKLKKRVKKLKKRRKSIPARLRRLKKIGTSKQVESSEEKDSLGAQEDVTLQDASKQGRSIEDIDLDVKIALDDESQGRMQDTYMFEVDDLEVTVASVEDSVAPTTVTIADVNDELTLANTLIAIKIAKPKEHDKVADDDTTKLKRCLEIVPEDDDDVAIKATLISSKSSTINFNREDLEVLRSIVKERFKKTKPVDDIENLLFQTLKTMFEPHVEYIIWKDQQRIYHINYVNAAYVQLVLLVYKVVAIFNKVIAAKSRVTTTVRVSTAG